MANLAPLTNQVWHVDAMKLLRELPSDCPNLVPIFDPPYGVGYNYYLDCDPAYWTDEADSATSYGEWFRPYYREIVRVTPIGGLVIFWQAIKYREHYQRWYGPHSRLVSIRFRRHYYPDVLILQRKTRSGMKPVRLHDNFMVNRYRKIDELWLRCAKTVAEVEEIINAYTSPESIILDCFAGIGTTGVAAKLTRRRFILAERFRAPWEVASRRLATVKL